VVTEVSRRALTVTYLGVEFPVGKLIAIEEALLGVTLGMIPIAIPVRDLFPPDLSPLSIPIAARPPRYSSRYPSPGVTDGRLRPGGGTASHSEGIV
jgi:hypothetical protein